MAFQSTPSAAHFRLHAFAGVWEGDERVAASAWTSEGKASAEFSGEVLFGGFAAAGGAAGG